MSDPQATTDTALRTQVRSDPRATTDAALRPRVLHTAAGVVAQYIHELSERHGQVDAAC